MTRQEMIDNLSADPGIKLLLDTKLFHYSSAFLTGGAIIDILEGRKPKDYDIIYKPTKEHLVAEGFEYLYDTKFSTTFTKEGLIFQFLKTKLDDFDFTIAQSSFGLNKRVGHNGEYLRSFTIDEVAFNNKTLIPVSFTNKKQILDSLKRIPHWKRKGYKIEDVTYFSLIDSLAGELKECS